MQFILYLWELFNAAGRQGGWRYFLGGMGAARRGKGEQFWSGCMKKCGFRQRRFQATNYQVKSQEKVSSLMFRS